MASRGYKIIVILSLLVLPVTLGVVFAMTPDAPPTAGEIAQERTTAEASRRQEVAAAGKAKADAAAEAVAEVRWRYAKRSLDQFRQSLMDPYSAKFRDVWAVQFGEGGMGVCGVVNAKNALGAYVGERPFIAVGDVSWTPDHPNFAGQFQAICLDGEKVEKMRVG